MLIFIYWPCILQSHWALVLTVWVFFIVDSLGFHVYKSMSFANRDHFTFSFSIWMPFIYFSCLLAVARTSSTMLNRDGKSRRLCLLPYFRSKKIQSFNINYDALCRCPLSDWGNSLVFLIPSALLSWKYLIFVKCFVCICCDNHVAFVLYSVSMVYYINWFFGWWVGLAGSSLCFLHLSSQNYRDATFAAVK